MKKTNRKYVYVALCHWFEQGNRDRLEHEVALFSSQAKSSKKVDEWVNDESRLRISCDQWKLPIQ